MPEVLSRADLQNDARIRAMAGRARCLLRPAEKLLLVWTSHFEEVQS